MVSELRKQSMAWMETDYSKHTHFQWKIKWRLEHLGALEIKGEAAPLMAVHPSPLISIFLSFFFLPFWSPFSTLLSLSLMTFLFIFPAPFPLASPIQLIPSNICIVLASPFLLALFLLFSLPHLPNKFYLTDLASGGESSQSPTGSSLFKSSSSSSNSARKWSLCASENSPDTELPWELADDKHWRRFLTAAAWPDGSTRGALDRKPPGHQVSLLWGERTMSKEDKDVARWSAKSERLPYSKI